MRLIWIPFLLIGLLGCESTAPKQVKKLDILTRSMVESDTTLKYRMQTNYPEIDSATSAWEIELNEQFLANVTADADSFRSFIQDFDPDMLRELEGTYRVHANQPQLLSISQRFVWAVPGTPILLGEVICTNYDRENKQFLTLADCLKNDRNGQLLQKVQAEVTKQYGIGICKEIELADVDIFTLEKAGMRFFIDAYGGNPACQQIEILIPFESLKDILKSQVTDAFS